MIKNRKSLLFIILIQALLILLLTVPLQSQTNYRLYFTDAAPSEYNKNLLQRPVSSQFKLFWEVWSEQNRQEFKTEYSSVSNIQIGVYNPEGEVLKSEIIPAADTSYSTEQLKVGSKYGFVIKQFGLSGIWLS